MLYSRGIFVASLAALSIVYLICLLGEKAPAATHEVSLTDITGMIDRDGARAVAVRLYARPDRWNTFLKRIETGADGWVRIGIVLHGQSDGAAREMLEESFGEALERRPSVLLALASQGKLKIEEFCIGPDVDDERYSSDATASRALDRRVIAVRAVNADALRPYRDSCLLALGSAAQHLHQFFDRSGE